MGKRRRRDRDRGRAADEPGQGALSRAEHHQAAACRVLSRRRRGDAAARRAPADHARALPDRAPAQMLLSAPRRLGRAGRARRGRHPGLRGIGRLPVHQGRARPRRARADGRPRGAPLGGARRQAGPARPHHLRPRSRRGPRLCGRGGCGARGAGLPRRPRP